MEPTTNKEHTMKDLRTNTERAVDADLAHADGIDRMLNRQDAQAEARTRNCQTCDAVAGERCTDRHGRRTSMVHASRHASDAARAADSYSMS